MNERIRELAMQTDRECEHLGQSDIGEDWVEKFAELIVQECVQTLRNRYMGDNNREDMEVRRCIEDVKKHFGVE